jgi:hypothetical protein
MGSKRSHMKDSEVMDKRKIKSGSLPTTFSRCRQSHQTGSNLLSKL